MKWIKLLKESEETFNLMVPVRSTDSSLCGRLSQCFTGQACVHEGKGLLFGVLFSVVVSLPHRQSTGVCPPPQIKEDQQQIF